MPTIKLLPKKKPGKRYGPRNDKRRKERQKVYQSRLYKDLREQKRRDNPICEVCLMRGYVRPMEHVHHLISFVGKPEPLCSELAYSYSNLISVCRKCHTNLHEGYLKNCTSIEDIKRKIEEHNKDEL